MYLKLLLMTGLPDLEQRLTQLVGQEKEGVEPASLDSMADYERLSEELFDVLVINRYMDQSDEGDEIVQFIKKIRNRNRDLQVIVLFAENELSVIQAMVNVGVYDLIISTPGRSLESICQSIYKCIQLPARQYDFLAMTDESNNSSDGKVPSGQSLNDKPGFSIKIARSVIVESVFKQVISIYAPLSASASITALNLAIALTELKKCRVVVLGLNLLNPQLSFLTKKPPALDIYQLLDSIDKRMPLSEVLEDTIVKLGGVSVIPGRFDYNEYYYLKEENLHNLIGSLQKHFDYVILDLNGYVSDKTTFVGLSQAHRTYLVCEPYGEPLKVIMEYSRLIRDKIPSSQVAGVVIENFGGMCLTSIEVEAILGQRPVAYVKAFKGPIKPDSHGYRRKVKKLYREFGKEVNR